MERLGVGALGAIGALVLAVAPWDTIRARAADYPWCYVDQTMSGSTYCAFATLAQCRENAGGNGGFCVRNPAWHGAPATDTPRSQHR